MAEVAVRRARHGDGDGVVRVWLDNARYYADLAPDLFRVPDAGGLAEWMDAEIPAPDDPKTLSLVAEMDGTVVGFLEASLAPPMASAHRQMVREVGETRVVVNALGVERRHWREGVGSRLMDAAESWGRDRGATTIALDTWEGSPVSVSFYEWHLGYERRQISFRKRL